MMRSDSIASIALAFLVALSIGLFFWVGNYSEAYFRDTKLPSRFPEKSLSYSADDLAKLMKSDAVGGYIFPILFPFDLIVMLALSLSMAAACWYWSSQLYPAAARFALLLPAIYLLSDLIEDSLLIWLLRRADPDLAASALSILKTVTTIKLASVTGSFAQTAIAFGAWLWHALR